MFKFCVIGGIFLHMFADSLLFDMMLNTAYEDGVNTPQDLIDREMSLGVHTICIIESVSQQIDFQLSGHVRRMRSKR